MHFITEYLDIPFRIRQHLANHDLMCVFGTRSSSPWSNLVPVFGLKKISENKFREFSQSLGPFGYNWPKDWLEWWIYLIRRIVSSFFFFYSVYIRIKMLMFQFTTLLEAEKKIYVFPTCITWLKILGSVGRSFFFIYFFFFNLKNAYIYNKVLFQPFDGCG